MSGGQRSKAELMRQIFLQERCPKVGGKSDGNHQERKSINCKTDSPRKWQWYEKNPNNSVVLGQNEHSSDRGFFSDDPDR